MNNGQGRARAVDALMSLGHVPCTTMIAGSVTDPKIPTMVGDSGRLAVAGLIGALPLAVATAAMTGASLMGTTAAAAASPNAGASAAQLCVTATPGAPGSLKLPECLSD
jgi:hypothetical protein